MEDITFIVISYERSLYLKRITDYFAQTDASIIVADGSAQPHPYTFSKQVRYFHRPDLNGPERLSLALSLVETTYVAACADDDFLVLDGVAAAVDFLDGNEDYSCCQGLTLCYLIPEPGKLALAPKYENLALESLRRNFRDDVPYNRLESLFRNFMQWAWVIHRTEHYRNTIEIVRGLDRFHPSFSDRMIGFWAALQGNLKVLPKLVSVREQAPPYIPYDQSFCVVRDSRDSECMDDFENLYAYLDREWSRKFGDSIGADAISELLSVYCESIEPQNRPKVGQPGRLISFKDEDDREVVIMREFCGEIRQLMGSSQIEISDLSQLHKAIFSNFSPDMLVSKKYPNGDYPRI
ncbi:MAG: TIGR00180 family glycosyltransferase [Alphaproteobacteria bacterium]|nr:TIGR00180 family glycosyltransferase [Alphaproteobacteria bacterium]